jgi:hypothetical protein
LLDRKRLGDGIEVPLDGFQGFFEVAPRFLYLRVRKA